jgi:tetratricopeptide (TPR) repeat protein
VLANAQAPADSGGGAAESASRGEAIRRYESLLNNASPALAGSRDEIVFRLGLLYLEDAQAAGPQSFNSRTRYDQALSMFQQTLSKGESVFREEALYYRAIAMEETGRGDEALAGFRTIVRDYPSSARASEVWFRLGNDAVQKNRVGEAVNAYQEVLRRGDPRYRDQSAYMYAWSAFATRSTASARATLIDLLTRLEANNQQKNNLYPEAVELLAKVVRSDGSTAVLSGPWVGPKPAFAPLVLRRVADLFKETSGFAQAAVAYEQLMRDYPDPQAADGIDKLVIECYAKAGDAPRAEEARERIINRHLSGQKIASEVAVEVMPILKDSALYLHQKARETKQNEFYRRAIQAYQIYAETVEAGPARWEILFLQADALKDMGDWNNAIDRYHTIAEAHDPKHGEESAFRRIALLEEAKTRQQVDLNRVLASYEDYFKLYPGGPHEVDLRARQAGYLYDDKRYADALVPGGAVVDRLTNPAERQKLELLMARASFANNDFVQSAKWVGKLLTEPNLPPATKAEGDEIRAAAILKSAEAQKDKPLDAAEQYELLARIYPKHPSAPASLYNAALLLRDNGQKNRAITLLRTLIEQYPQSDLAKDATAAAAELYTQSGDAAGAADFLARAANSKSGPESGNLLYEAATQARTANSTAQAMDFYQRFLATRPPSDLRATTARIYIAEQFGRQGRVADAERMARETISTTAMTGTPDQLQQTQLAMAKARLIIGDAGMQRAESTRLSEPVAMSLKKKQQAMELALDDLRAAAAYGFADVSLASYYKIGYLQLDFANAVMQAPRPKTLTADQRNQYDALLSEQMKPYREGAEKAFRTTLEQAKVAGVDNEWVSRARSALVQFGGERPAAAPAAAPPAPAS